MKNIKNMILSFTLSTLLFGCSQSATSVFDKDPIYGQNIQYSKVVKIIDKDIVKAIFNITYLNSVDSWEWNNDKQNFLIGTFTTDNNASQYTLTMNNLEQLSSTPLKNEDEISKNIAFKNHWAKYNIVSFKNSDEKILTLTYTYDNNQTVSTTFVKE
jgi:hypothetical protein